MPFAELARKYEDEFFRDMDTLNVGRPDLTLRVSEHIDDIIDFIKCTIDNKMAYVSSDGSVYFDVGAYGPKKYEFFKNVQHASPDSVANENKKSPADFALWKSAKPGEPSWPVVWTAGGKTTHGRPGWHIECSTLSKLAFGSSFDIHSGGEDLIFPHHQNEVAQTVAHGCVCHPKEWVAHWLHTGHLHLVAPGGKNDEKMSKSLGNIVTVSQLLGANHELGNISVPEFRIFVASTHYRDRMFQALSFLFLL